MDTDKSKILNALFSSESTGDLNKVTELIIGAAFKVGNSLGCGFLEKVYENALAHELRKSGLTVVAQQEINVHYDEIVVGSYCADLLVDSRILIELKAVRDLNDIHKAQCINYLKATKLKLCLLINFGNPRVEVKRLVL